MQEQIELGKSVLKGVSRSFYITIRLLPRLMREPISLGYLLARASDTIADTEEVPASVRESCLKKFTLALKDKEVRALLVEQVEKDFVPLQTNKKEQLLLRRLNDVFRWYDSVISWSWDAIGLVIGYICKGQMNDINRFAILNEEKLQTSEELEEYCYLVAGCVGEFWSEVGWQANHRFSRLEREELDKLGREYGKGLQLVNILRDLPEDIKNGRCYLPVKNPTDPKEVMRAAKKWRKKARKYINSGLKYSKSLRQKRAKVATVLPALLAIETLNLLDQADWTKLESGVKVDRKTVKQCFWKSLWF